LEGAFRRERVAVEEHREGERKREEGRERERERERAEIDPPHCCLEPWLPRERRRMPPRMKIQ